MVDESLVSEIELKVAEVFVEDVGKGLARFDPADVKALGASLGDIVEIAGEERTVARISGIFPEHLGKKLVQIDGYTRENAKVQIGGTVGSRRRPGKRRPASCSPRSIPTTGGPTKTRSATSGSSSRGWRSLPATR